MSGVLIGLITRYGWDLLGAIGIAMLGWVAAGWAARGVRSFGRRSARLDPTLVPILSNVSRVTILVATLVAVLDKFGVDTKSLLAVLGAAGLAVGLALKDTLSDVAAGIVLLVLRPFDVGDAVDIDGTSGTVDAIDIFQTKLTSPEGVPIVLPNTKVRAGKVQNFTRAARRRFDLTLEIRYTDDLEQAVAALRSALAEEPRVLDDPAPLVEVSDIEASSVKLLVRAWTAPDEGMAIETRLEIARLLKERLAAEGVAAPFSTKPAPQAA